MIQTNLFLEALETCLQALTNLPAGEAGQCKTEIETIQQALLTMRALVKQPLAEAILYDLKLLRYAPEHGLFRVTAEDFADLLAEHLARRGVIPADLVSDELEHLVTTTCDYLNGEGLPWAEVVRIALEDAWPERLKGSAA